MPHGAGEAAHEGSADAGQLTVTYRPALRYDDGRAGTELRRAQLVRLGGGFLIDNADLVS
ncbi:hypothetical protein [Nocardia tengchongensis]|uniref:hypothetical protein n=1 Tax=Nocardia tengchongensis TaxID=2055889 RepID=UPI003622D147